MKLVLKGFLFNVDEADKPYDFFERSINVTPVQNKPIPLKAPGAFLRAYEDANTIVFYLDFGGKTVRERVRESEGYIYRGNNGTTGMEIRFTLEK